METFNERNLYFLILKKKDAVLKKKKGLTSDISMRSLAMIFYNEIITGIFVEYTDMKIKSFLKLIYFLIEG